MMQFTTTLTRQLSHAALEHLASAMDDEDLEDEVEIEVEVEYHPGYFQAGNRAGHPDNWTPDEGDDPEIETVTIIETGEEIDVTDAEYKALVEEAWADQEAAKDFW
jgi:hypothetical protein